MTGGQRRFADGDGLLEERLRLAIAALGPIQSGEVAVPGGESGMGSSLVPTITGMLIMAAFYWLLG